MAPAATPASVALARVECHAPAVDTARFLAVCCTDTGTKQCQKLAKRPLLNLLSTTVHDRTYKLSANCLEMTHVFDNVNRCSRHDIGTCRPPCTCRHVDTEARTCRSRAHSVRPSTPEDTCTCSASDTRPAHCSYFYSEL